MGEVFLVSFIKLRSFVIRTFCLFSLRETFLRLMSENLLNRTLVDTALPFGGELNGRQRPQNKRVMAHNA